jgi:hypothetical protein
VINNTTKIMAQLEKEDLDKKIDEALAKVREIIVDINSDIVNNEFKPSDIQQEIIDAYLEIGKKLLAYKKARNKG